MMKDTERRHVVVLGLRRSGTTTVFRLLRQDPGFTCYDEPFNPMLSRLPADNGKQTWAEFIRLHEAGPERFRETYAPIPLEEETQRGLTARQKEYLGFLTRAGPTATDVTRCTGKIPDIAEVLPNAVMVHLFRHPTAFASSHMVPSEHPSALRRALLRFSMFWRSSHFDSLGLEQLVRTAYAEQTRALFEPEGVVFRRGRRPAIEMLLAFWLGAWRLTAREGQAAYGPRYIEVPFEKLCAEPTATLDLIYTAAEAVRPSIDLSGLHAASPGVRPGDPRWRRAAESVGFSKEELRRFFPES